MADIHASAVVDPGAELGEGVRIGPFCTVGSGVSIGNHTELVSHVVVDGQTKIGQGCRIFPFSCIGTQTQDLKFKGENTFVEIGDNTTLREYVTVNSGTNEGEVTRVGSDCHIMAYCHVAHACIVGNEVIMANCATLAGEVQVEDQAIIGGMVGVHQFVRIGRLCIVGGCTKLTQDCLPFMTVDGNPARIRGINRIGLERRGVPRQVQGRIKDVYRILCRDGLSTSQALDRIRTSVPACPEVNHILAFIGQSDRGLVK